MSRKPALYDLNLSLGTKIMLVFFILFTLAVCTCSYHGYITEKNRMITSYSENIEQSETAITTTITLVSRGTMLLNSIYDTPMANALNQVESAYTASGGDPSKMNLPLLRDSIQENFTDDVDLYIIDEKNVIIDTTDMMQIGADFSSYPTFAERLTDIREGTNFVGDPWEQSLFNPYFIRRYAYLPTDDHRYLLEIGLYNTQLSNPSTLSFSYDDVIDNLETADNAIESVLIIDANGVFMEKNKDEMAEWRASHQYISFDSITDTAARVLQTGDGIEKTYPEQERLVHVFRIDPGYGTPLPSDTMYTAVVVYSTEELNSSLAETFSRYLFIFVGGLVFAAAVGYIVAYTLGRPVEMIAEDVNEIAKGNLTHEIRHTHGYELRRLEDSIRILVKRLGEDISKIQAQSTAIDIELKEKTLVEKRLRDANRKLSLLSTITRHDILNQLGVLGMYCDLLEELTDHCPGLSEYISRIEQTLKKIERQLTFARDYESMGLEEPRFQYLSDVVENALLSIHTPYLHFSVKTDGAEICADPMLEKVFYNLFENAIRHGGDNLSEIAITFTGTQRKTGSIIVTDNGDGVAISKKQKIFQQGYGSNTGYGLFLVAEILSITGITIRECGTEGKGARFEMEVPPASWRLRRDDE